MPWCKVGSGAPVVVDSKQDCDALRGDIVPGPGDAGTGSGGNGGSCFIRNVLTRGLGELMLDLGVGEQVSVRLARNAEIPREAGEETRTTEGKLLDLSPALRLGLCTFVMRSIMKLAPTYRTGLDFRLRIFLETPRGRELVDDYEHYLPEIYRIARNDYTLLNDLASAWLDVHPFIAAMVALRAGAGKEKPDVKRHTLSERSYEQGQDLIRRFGAATEDKNFRALTEELSGELKEYRGLNAEQALAKVVDAPARRKGGGGGGRA
jgi:hypothetical protein